MFLESISLNSSTDGSKVSETKKAKNRCFNIVSQKVDNPFKMFDINPLVDQDQFSIFDNKDLTIDFKDASENSKIDKHISSSSEDESVNTPRKRCPTNLSFSSSVSSNQIVDKSMSDLDIFYTEDMIGKEFQDIDLELEAIAQEYMDELIAKLSYYKGKKNDYQHWYENAEEYSDSLSIIIEDDEYLPSIGKEIKDDLDQELIYESFF